MTTVQLMDKHQSERPVVWETFPSWAQFSWLYLLSTLSVLRAALFYRFGADGWEVWMIGAGVLLACAALLRHWEYYELTRDQVRVRNGYTGHEIQSIPLSDVREVVVRQGFIAQLFRMGTLIIHSQTSDQMLSLRGVRDPEAMKIRIDALVRKRHRTGISSQSASA